MKLPNAENAILDLTKLREYCLSSIHFRGRNKARLFHSALGMTVEDAFELQAALLRAAIEAEAVQGASDPHGTRFIIDSELNRGPRTAIIRSAWLAPTKEAPPRFLTCYVL